MEQLQKIYQELTGIDLVKQRLIWDERGKGYYGEYLVFKELFLNIVGNSKFLMNLQLPTKNNKTTEIDLIMIHETGIYVFEVKHYKGKIYGSVTGNVWTQFFKTKPNNKFLNPVVQNEYHIEALKELVHNIPIFSVVVFSNSDCEIHVNNEKDTLMIVNLDDLSYNLYYQIQNKNAYLTMDEIDIIFTNLKSYSSIKDKIVVSENEVEIPFYQYIHKLKKDMDENVQKLKDEYLEKEKKIIEEKYNFRLLLIAVIITCMIGTIIFCNWCQENYYKKLDTVTSELSKTKEQLEHAKKLNNIINIDNIVKISNIKLDIAKNLENTVIFTCTLNVYDDYYGILLNKNTTYLVLLKDGTLQEYDMFGERLMYNEDVNKLSGTSDKFKWKHTGTLKELEIYEVKSIEEIKSIKITNVSIWKLSENNNEPLKKGLELELYSK